MKRPMLLSLLAILLLVLCGCSVISPIEKAETTAAPGLSMDVYPATASATNADDVVATLYFRYLDQPMLAAESRVITVDRDKSFELTLIEELLAGPSTSHVDLQKLFSDSVRVISASARNGVLYVTFNDALLDNDSIPSDWQSRSDWADEAPLLRKLALQSVVASITESMPYTGVQFFVSQSADSTTSTRLENTYFLTGQGGVSDPLLRNESLLLTPHNTAQCILQAWQQRDYKTLYLYTAMQSSGESRPIYDIYHNTVDACSTLSEYSVSSGSISQSGTHATLILTMSTLREGLSTDTQAYPLQLQLENGVWKISYSALLELISR